ncbi:hypothetical protein HRR76_004658 [Exophiala dermatitidis]|nr:hypothetical protein HRR76_004658 [Exophiala dermatitidis]KAJ4555772.1 hypothetical protein HRR77_001696 [Exophiala dermatitidis]KAJ4604127.1 hypothetical protein HRR84_001205 [Exophiala dermatitidis]KAJ4674955.1 hypothetical protein HRR93_004311 [Exophiala dermatitidis]KAJ4684649.1 hypothetical protein HRR92_001204 [Exophiala dermatitidis]
MSGRPRGRPRKSGPPATNSSFSKVPSVEINSKPNSTKKRPLFESETPLGTTSPATATATPGSRSSKRLKELSAASTTAQKPSSKTTPTRSKYFQHDDDEEDDDEPEIETADEVENSGYEDEDASVTEDDPSSDSESDSDGFDDDSEVEGSGAKKRKRLPKKQNKSKTTTTTINDNKELWRPGVKTGLGPGKAVFIEKPKPRGDGGIKYVPHKIHPNTMAFLKDLRNNNDREWLKMHDADYRQSWKDWESFVESLTEKISEIDETIPELPPKDLVFRIYRDIRFSSDPTPYKPHFSAAWSRTGRKGPYADYYVQIKPGGKSYVGAGLWSPEAQALALIRADIDRKPKRLRRILTDPRMRKEILGGIPNDGAKAIKAFAAQNSDNALKTKPKGYEANNPNIELLRLRNFTLGKPIPDEVVVSEQGLQKIVELIGVMVPFVTYLNSVVMPDEDDEDESSSGETDA